MVAYLVTMLPRATGGRATAPLLLLLLAVGVAAQPLPDPTRPPKALARAAETPGQPSSDVLRLESVLISPQRRFAIINGETVRAGDVLGDARVLRIEDARVVLRVGDETRVLDLYPGIEKKSVPARQAERRGTEKK